MQFQGPLIDASFVRRYKRFFADVVISGKAEVAHIPNTGSMKGLLTEGAPCRVTQSNDPKRKLKYTLEFLKAEKSWVGVNTQNANKLAWEAWENKIFTHWSKYDSAKKEVKISKESRLDLALSINGEIRRYVEVKSVTMAKSGLAMFPDAETVRGQKHLLELMKLKASGFEVEMLFIVQRTDCESFRAAHEIDSEYAKLLETANKKGVDIYVYAVDISDDRMQINPKTSLPLGFHQ